MLKTVLRSALVATLVPLMAACGGSGAEEAPEAAPTPPPAAAPQAEITPPDATPAEPPAPSAEFAALPAPYSEADFALGQRVWRQCSTCHTLEDGEANRIGPNLYGLFGSVAGSRDDFNYSDALSEADFAWTPEQLDNWLANPRQFLPGNRMSFAGIRRESDRTAAIAYIMANTGYVTPEQ